MFQDTLRGNRLTRTYTNQRLITKELDGREQEESCNDKNTIRNSSFGISQHLGRVTEKWEMICENFAYGSE